MAVVDLFGDLAETEKSDDHGTLKDTAKERRYRVERGTFDICQPEVHREKAHLDEHSHRRNGKAHLKEKGGGDVGGVREHQVKTHRLLPQYRLGGGIHQDDTEKHQRNGDGTDDHIVPCLFVRGFGMVGLDHIDRREGRQLQPDPVDAHMVGKNGEYQSDPEDGKEAVKTAKSFRCNRNMFVQCHQCQCHPDAYQ